MADTYEIEIMPKWAQAGIANLADMAGKAVGGAVGMSGAGGVAKAAGAGMGIASSIGAAALGPIGAVVEMVSKFAKFIDAFAPAAALMEQFNMAVSDAFAVVGQALMPAFQLLIPYVQMLGDFLASIMPDFNSYFSALLPVLDTMKGYLTAIAPIIGTTLQLGIQALAIGVQALVKVFDFAVRAIAQVAVWALKLIPGFVSSDLNKLQKNLENFVSGGTGEFAKTSRGLSGQGAQKVGLQELQSQMFSAALGKSDPMVNEQQKTNGFLGLIVTAMQQKTAAEWGGGFTGNDPPTTGGGDF